MRGAVIRERTRSRSGRALASLLRRQLEGLGELADRRVFAIDVLSQFGPLAYEELLPGILEELPRRRFVRGFLEQRFDLGDLRGRRSLRRDDRAPKDELLVGNAEIPQARRRGQRGDPVGGSEQD